MYCGCKEMSKFNIKKIWENINQNWTKQKVHIFNKSGVSMQGLNKKEWKLFELQITQCKHPKVV